MYVDLWGDALSWLLIVAAVIVAIPVMLAITIWRDED